VNAGPYETERDARKAAIEQGGPAEPDWSILSPGQRYKLLLNACADAGVFLGAYDHRILEWLAGWEDATVAVVAGLITRAHAAGQDARGGPGTAQPGGGWISGPST
jgi:hypothetical protein